MLAVSLRPSSGAELTPPRPQEQQEKQGERERTVGESSGKARVVPPHGEGLTPSNARSGERPPVRDDGKRPTRGVLCDTALDSSGCRVEGTVSVDLIKVTEDGTQPEPQSRDLQAVPLRKKRSRWTDACLD